MVSLAKNYCDDPDKAAAPKGGSRIAEYATISLYRLRTFLNGTYKMIIDRLEMKPPILEIAGLEPAISRIHQILTATRATAVSHSRDTRRDGHRSAPLVKHRVFVPYDHEYIA